MAITMLIGEPEELAKFSLELQKQARSQVGKAGVDSILEGVLFRFGQSNEARGAAK